MIIYKKTVMIREYYKTQKQWSIHHLVCSFTEEFQNLHYFCCNLKKQLYSA